MTSYSIMLYHEKTRKYEFLTEVVADSTVTAIKDFRKTSGWIDIKDTMLFAKPPICR